MVLMIYLSYLKGTKQYIKEMFHYGILVYVNLNLHLCDVLTFDRDLNTMK